jgi:hypothetical protein
VIVSGGHSQLSGAFPVSIPTTLGAQGVDMAELDIFQDSAIQFQGSSLFTGRDEAADVLLAFGPGADQARTGLTNGRQVGDHFVFPATLENMLVWERQLAPTRRLLALNRTGHGQGFGAGNRIVASWADLPVLRARRTFAGWDGIFQAMYRSAVPFWFVQQSIVRELIPEGVDPGQHPGIGHTGGYGPRELLRAGLFAFASLGGYTQLDLPIGADADHAIVTGRDEESLSRSLALNKLAINESRDYTKFTVDTSHLFNFPVELEPADQRRLMATFRGRTWKVPNILSGWPGFEFQFTNEQILRLGRKYWRACAVHKELYDLVVALRGDEPFDYELSLDETPEPTPPGELLFYLVLLEEVLGLPPGGVASAGPNIGFIKRHDYQGDRQRELWPQVNASASILHQRGAMLSVHSADGVRASTGKGSGVDAVLASATGGWAELKVADVYQEILWQVLAASPERGEREIFLQAWRRTGEAVRQLADIYRAEVATHSVAEALQLLATLAGQEEICRRYSPEASNLVQAVIGYGLPLFKLAADLLAVTDLGRPDPEAELFRRFMFLTFRGLRPALFQTMDPAGWQRLAAAIEEATWVRLAGMGWGA